MRRLLLLILLLIPFAGCKAGQGDRCAKSEDCGSGLVCFAPTEAQGSFIKTQSYKNLEPYLDSYTCVTPEDLAEAAQAYLDADCRALESCKEYGYCTSKDGECQAVSDADCKGSIPCKDWGRCTAKDGYCQATIDADCKRSEACSEVGWCTANKNGGCQATSDADCRASGGCEDGYCTAKDGECVK